MKTYTYIKLLLKEKLSSLKWIFHPIFVVLFLGTIFEGPYAEEIYYIVNPKAKIEMEQNVFREEQKEESLRNGKIKKKQLATKYIEQYKNSEHFGTEGDYYYIEDVEQVYDLLEYKEVGGKVEVIFTDEAQRELGIPTDEMIKEREDAFYTEKSVEDEYWNDYYGNYDTNGDSNNAPDTHYVNEYIRTNSDGTTSHVDGHIRSNPDGNPNNNLSSP